MAMNGSDPLLRGGGVSNLTLKTDNKQISSFGIQLEHVEYMHFENLVLENFFKSALMGCFWESNFENLTFRASGADIKSDNGVPDYGVLDFDSHSTSTKRDAPNNTNFTKLTFSSCFGTHIRAAAYANSIVNINIFGLYDETYPFDGGAVDNLPIYFFKGVKNFNITGGFLTVNTTNVNRNAYCVQIANDKRNGTISFNNFEFLLNYKVDLFTQNKTRRLKSFIYLENNQQITLNNVSLNDASGSVGLNFPSRYLIDGESGSLINLTNVTFHVKKGIWNAGNIVSPKVSKKGNITLIYYNDEGPTGEKEYITYNLGKAMDGNATN